MSKLITVLIFIEFVFKIFNTKLTIIQKNHQGSGRFFGENIGFLVVGKHIIKGVIELI